MKVLSQTEMKQVGGGTLLLLKLLVVKLFAFKVGGYGGGKKY